MGSHLKDIRTQQVVLLAVRPEGRSRESNIICSLQTESWMDNIRAYLETRHLPEDKNEARRIRKAAEVLPQRRILVQKVIFNTRTEVPKSRRSLGSDEGNTRGKLWESCWGEESGNQDLEKWIFLAYDTAR
ncbi:UNVERIFIED_CONTAM: hypothetical protein Sradi_7180800 [Sesamum radiatum]|uniref:Uncharacterized protein n=1 Tax=Sesamum radiatum TaxID=300843 RepID=A0AAW2IT27_SESRA